MKYRIVRNDLRPSYPDHPLGWVPEDMVEFTETREAFGGKPTVFWKIGTEFDNEWGPDMVKAGVAEPMDDECREACQRTPAQIAAAQKAYERTRLGVHPEDFDAFDKGYMVGYIDGEWVPGPNYAEWEAEQNQPEEEDDDL